MVATVKVLRFDYVSFIVLLIATSCFGFGLKLSLPVGRIVGGREAEPHAHPYQVSLQIKVLWMRAHFCGGSILSERWILTAGHCITELPLPWLLPIDVVAGAHRVSGKEDSVQIRRVIEKVVHPDYKGGVAAFDLALLRLDHALRYSEQVRAIRLPASKSTPAGRSTLTGWGVLRSSIIPASPEKLQTIELPVVPYPECHNAIEDLKDADETNPLNEESNICTGPLSGGKSACNGDSGGPLVQYEDQETSVESTTTGSEAVSTTENLNDLPSGGQQEIQETSDGEDSTSSEAQRGEKPLELRRRTAKKCLVREELPLDGPVQIGIVSWGMQPCGSEGAPTVYTRVSSFIEFIDEHIYSIR